MDGFRFMFVIAKAHMPVYIIYYRHAILIWDRIG